MRWVIPWRNAASRLAVTAAALLFSVSATRGAFAQVQDTADEAELRFQLGAEAYQAGDYRRALEHFLVSNRLSPNANVTFNIARSYQQLARYPEAYRYYQEAHRSAANDEERSSLEGSLKDLEKFVVVLDVRTSPAGATLYVDRIELGARGEAPRKLGLGPGKYRIIARKPGYKDAMVTLDDLPAGSHAVVDMVLDALLGEVSVTGNNVEGATLSAEVGGQRVACQVPCELSLPPGANVVRVERPGYRAEEAVVDIVPEKRSKLFVSLGPSNGTLVVEADEVGALIELDGKPVGFTPGLFRTPVGKHTLRVVHPGSEPHERQIEIAEDETTKLVVSFVRENEVVAASRRSERVSEAPGSVTIIPKEELNLFVYPTLVEALRGTPGVYQWNDRAYPSLGVRGIGRLGSYGNRVLILNDEHPANDNWVGSSYVGFDARTDLADVERIEIVRGPGSVLFGTNAIAGVVNVVNRDVGDENQTELGVSAVQDGVGRARVRQDVRLGDETSLWASVGAASGDGTAFSIPGNAPGEMILTERRADRITAGTAQLHLEHRDFQVRAFGHSSDKHQPTGWFDTIVGDPRAKQRDSRAYIEARFEPSITEQLTGLSRVHVNYYGYRGVFPRAGGNGGVENDRFDGSWVGLEQRFVYSPFEILSLTVGGEGQVHYLMDQRAGDDDGLFLDDQRELLVGAAYGMADLFWGRARLSVGARLDAYSTFGSSVNPRVAFVAHPYDTGTSKITVGKAFRAPSIYELYYNDGGFTQVASPSLGPEQAWSTEVQHIHQFDKFVSASLGAFANRVTNLVTTVGMGTSADPIEYVNSNRPLATVGIEATLRREWGQGWMAELGYTLQTGAFLQSENFGDIFTWTTSDAHQDVANLPSHLGLAKGAIPILGKALTLGSRITLESGRRTREELESDGEQGSTHPFFIWDLVLSGREASGFSYSLGVYNLTDNSYELPVSAEFRGSSFPQAGRSLLAQLGLVL